MSEMDMLHTGGLYLPGDDEIVAEQQKCMELFFAITI